MKMSDRLITVKEECCSNCKFILKCSNNENLCLRDGELIKHDITKPLNFMSSCFMTKKED